MCVELAHKLSLLLSPFYSLKMALLGLHSRGFLLEPRMLTHCRGDSYSISLRFWLVGSLSDTSVVELHLLYVAEVKMHRGKTLVSRKFSIVRLASPS